MELLHSFVPSLRGGTPSGLDIMHFFTPSLRGGTRKQSGHGTTAFFQEPCRSSKENQIAFLRRRTSALGTKRAMTVSDECTAIRQCILSHRHCEEERGSNLVIALLHSFKTSLRGGTTKQSG